VASKKSDREKAAFHMHEFHVRCRAKAGIVALQGAAASARRAAAESTKIARALELSTRAASATDRLAALMQARVSTAAASAQKKGARTMATDDDDDALATSTAASAIAAAVAVAEPPTYWPLA